MTDKGISSINLDSRALAALNTESDVPLKVPPTPLSPLAVQVIRKMLAKTIFGPLMKPTFKQQLLTFVSFAAIKASWAADHFQKVQRTKT